MEHQQADAPRVAVSKLLDIEENIWSPRYGLKGKVDATVEIEVIRFIDRVAPYHRLVACLPGA